MIPIKLQIKNFLSYGSETQIIDFEPYNLMCLSGKNGHGKSALLDAMTWVIWGEARKVSGITKADQGLLRLGQRQMMVIFDFEFNKNKYRIRREFTNAYGKAYAFLEFGMFENNEKLISLTDKTIRATQEKIQQMIGLNYDSFINSAFLKQGNSNEFSKKSPKERKEILATILGLNKYEMLRKAALEKVKKFTSEKDTNLKITELIEKDLEIFDSTRENLLKVTNELESIASLENCILDDKKNIEQEKNKLAKQIQEYRLIEFQLTKMLEEKTLKTNQVYQLYAEWKAVHRNKIESKNFKNLEIEKEELFQYIESIKKQNELKLECRERLLKYKEKEQKLLKDLQDKFILQEQEFRIRSEQYLTNKKNIEERLNQINNELENWKAEIKKIDLEAEDLSSKIENIDDDSLNKLELKFEKRKTFYSNLVTKGNFIKGELSSLEQKLKLSSEDEAPICPLCEQGLSVCKINLLQQKFIKQQKFYNHRYNRTTKLIPLLKKNLVSINEDINNRKKLRENNKLLNYQIDEQIKQKKIIIEKITQLNITVNQLIGNVNDIDKKIEFQNIEIENLIKSQKDYINNNEEYKSLQLTLNQLNQQINQISYDQDSAKQAQIRIEKIEAILATKKNSLETNIIQDMRRKEISDLCKYLKELKQKISILENKVSIMTELVDQDKILQDKEINIIEKIKKYSEEKEILLHKKGSLENQSAKLDQLSERHKIHKKNVSKLEEAIDEYKTISVALSKDGIQALLIEDALPEIENEANDLLSKLTDNQAQIFIESLRDLKKGGTKETLDIKISDNSGIRPYEMFSGGEAFRIDFALRIAISKLLARRAGTSLQTLIIDEGFGSQDEEGLSLIMDSIYKIQEDFAKIIIVSHLPSMKDQFPVHFLIEKTPSGSKVRIVEQG